MHVCSFIYVFISLGICVYLLIYLCLYLFIGSWAHSSCMSAGDAPHRTPMPTTAPSRGFFKRRGCSHFSVDLRV